MLDVSNYKEFLTQFDRVEGQSRLFLFILFDSRPTQRAVEKFVNEQFDWLDNLAAAANIFGFAFLRRDRQTGGIFNPSLKVASLFGIRANQLPGIILFTTLQEADAVNQGIYLPLKANLFDKDPAVIEDVFADLFSFIQEAQERTSIEEQLLEKLRRDVVTLSRRQKLRPILNFLGDRLETLTKLPDRLLESMAEAFGEGLVKQLGA